MSVAHITKPDLVVNGVAVPGGLEDPRLGTCDYHATCKTCKNTYTGTGGRVNDCPGHFGHIEVREAVWSIYSLVLGVSHSCLRPPPMCYHTVGEACLPHRISRRGAQPATLRVHQLLQGVGGSGACLRRGCIAAILVGLGSWKRPHRLVALARTTPR